MRERHPGWEGWQHIWECGVTFQRNYDGILKAPRAKLDTKEVDATSVDNISTRKLALTEEIEKAEAKGEKQQQKNSCKKERHRERLRERQEVSAMGLMVSCGSNSVVAQSWQQWDSPESWQDRTMTQQAGRTPGQKLGQ